MSDAKHHPRKDLEQVRNYVAEVIPHLRMQNWDILIHPEVLEPDDDVDGTVWAETGQNQNHWSGHIKFSRDFFEEADAEQKRHIVVHELIHFQHRDVYETWNACINDNDDIAESQAHAYTGDFKMHMERFVSWVTQWLTPLAPSWPGAQKPPKQGVWIAGEQTGC